jgi:predicted phosphodiesterase
MNIQLLSDLHLETHPHFVPKISPLADALVLAGDIGSYQTGSMLLDQHDPDFGLARFSPRKDLAAWPVPVFFVPGNTTACLLKKPMHGCAKHASDWKSLSCINGLL